jgi:SWI/SNF-related matrix-associated actin-dependent regulator 1 of chromatin subfamily A
MRVVFTENIFRCICSYDEREIPQRAGFRWHNDNKYWYTPNPAVASRLEDYLDPVAQKQINKTRISSTPWTKPLAIPRGETLLPFQENAALFALARNRSYLALDPGLGKTPTAAVVVATLFENCGPLNVVYICPPFLTRNTEAEFQRFAPKVPVVRYGEDKKRFGVTIVPDSIIARDEVQFEIFRKTKDNVPTILFIDEAHRFKNDEAARTQAIFGKKRKGGIAAMFERVVYLSGTPMPNRPIELYPVLSASAPQTIDHMSKHDFAVKYCAAYQNAFGWDYSGASNIKELVARVMDTFMLRIKKAEVLKDLPPKIEEMVVLNDEMPAKLTKLSSTILDSLSPDDLMSGRISADLGKDVLHLSTYRKELGVHKVKASLDFIRFVLEETEENILVFAIHKDVIASLATALEHDGYEPIVVTGDTDMKLRHERVKEYQLGGKRVFIGNIQAAGTGLTLTKATRVIFVEFSWVPADNDQASDRAHRIGQVGNVFVQYLVFESSVDKAVIETVLRKKRITEQL